MLCQAKTALTVRGRSREVVRRADHRDSLVAARITGRLLLNDRGLVITAALDGLGLAYVAEARVRELIAEKRLVRVFDAWCPPFPGLFLYYPSRANIAPKLRALVDFLKKPDTRRRRGGA